MTRKKIARIIITVVALFVSASLIGHWIEMLWMNISITFFGISDNFGILRQGIFHFAPVYGVGAVGCTAIGYLVNKYFKNVVVKILICFIACTIFCALAEYATAAVIVASYGNNPFWDYSGIPFNLHGYICLQNCLLFGALGTVVAMSGLPKILDKWITSKK